ncbi:MAG: hypothetical protein FJ279_12470 [Planctomycetes bacterium]|nr:hypothetical protein [Planctomycetota bacterium]MBM4079762.1 hypothetical protein [Planctomycetota bacterium]MBM4084249.1 hypothetical protein [Planctomycetota bacterium]
MSCITDAHEARDIYTRYAEIGVPIARIGSSTYMNNEALIRAASEFATERGIKRMAISLFFTANYPNMSQLRRMTTCRSPEFGFHVATAMVRALVGSRYSPYRNVDVILHLDHGQADADKSFLYDLVDEFATINFDAGIYPFQENIRRTKEYMQFVKGRALVEGAVEEVSVAGVWDTKQKLTTPAQAVEFMERTGVDFVVPNVGTESQRETTESLKYARRLVQDIYKALGRKAMVIHGVSCLSLDELATLSDDGAAGVNIWTRFARAAGEHARRALAEYQVPPTEKDPNRRFDPMDIAYSRAWIEKFVSEVKEFLANLGYGRLAGKV